MAAQSAAVGLTARAAPGTPDERARAAVLALGGALFLSSDALLASDRFAAPLPCEVGALMAAPGHPYSAGLLAATVGAEHRGRPLTTIAGAPPDLSSAAPGCAFAPRCAQASVRCGVEQPALVRDAGQALACWHPLHAPVPAMT